MAERTRAKDKSSLHQYRIELPKLIDDMGLSVYEFRLYAHLKRIAEEKGGTCWESARTLAAACGMSPGQVSKAKEGLEQRGLITRGIKLMRGGVGDDIAIIDIWPETFKRYASASDPVEESDHHTITSTPKAITTRSLTESDHHTITSEESDHHTITETIKRSYSDPNSISTLHGDHESSSSSGASHNGVDDDFFKQLRQRGISAKKAREIVATGADRVTVLTSIDNLHDPADQYSMGRLVGRLVDAPPPAGQPWTRAQPKAASAAPATWQPAPDALTPAERAAAARALRNGAKS